MFTLMDIFIYVKFLIKRGFNYVPGTRMFCKVDLGCYKYSIWRHPRGITNLVIRDIKYKIYGLNPGRNIAMQVPSPMFIVRVMNM